MKSMGIFVLFVHVVVLTRLCCCETVYEIGRSRTTAVNPPQALSTADSSPEYYDEDEDEDHSSGHGDLRVPRVEFSTKPKDLTAVSGTEKNRKKGRGRKNLCLKDYKDYCVHGVCKHHRQLRSVSCICHSGYSGERCHLFSLPVSTEVRGYDRTTALAVVAVVLSLLCLTIIGVLLAHRYFKKHDSDVESEEKLKLESSVN
ncbi:heparin-binding EGF-like growth factor b [Denticeps clupeoides]|uniref:Proheparin-binding EGF-like growth factor n=1 Tax=Denticeps clupeoides TaxID=299321 RepID=A0AAY4AKF4_9TELE|nr:proheparin-binding EGF-like growth factor [Denticeps clupeoides]